MSLALVPNLDNCMWFHFNQYDDDDIGDEDRKTKGSSLAGVCD